VEGSTVAGGGGGGGGGRAGRMAREKVSLKTY